jgi:hypothetical protein
VKFLEFVDVRLSKLMQLVFLPHVGQQAVQLPDQLLLKQGLNLESGRVHDTSDDLVKEQIVFLTIKVFPERLLLERNRCREVRKSSDRFRNIWNVLERFRIVSKNFECKCTMNHTSNMIGTLLKGNAIAESILSESKESKGIVTRGFIDVISINASWKRAGLKVRIIVEV